MKKKTLSHSAYFVRKYAVNYLSFVYDEYLFNTSSKVLKFRYCFDKSKDY